MEFIELIKALFIGIVQGITEWLPISSTGHMILFDEFVKLQVSSEFREMFFVVIQFGSIMAVIILYFQKLNPFSFRKNTAEKRATLMLWAKVIVACIPAAIVGILLDSWAEEHFFNAVVVAGALAVYGVAFIVIERVKGQKAAPEAPVKPGKHFAPRSAKENDELANLSFPRAIGIGCFQCLAIIPGTSRSGSTILGGLILGVSRKAAAEFSFFLAIPVMFGWSLLKVVKVFLLEQLIPTTTEWGVLGVGVIVAFVVSILAIRFLMGYIKRNSFEAFGWYRIALGILVLVYFLVISPMLG